MLPPDEKGYKITPFHRRCFIGNRGGERERVAFSNPCCCTPFLPLLERFLFFFPDKRSVIKRRNFVCNLVRGGGGIFRPSNYECLRMIQEWIVLIRIEIHLNSLTFSCTSYYYEINNLDLIFSMDNGALFVI